MSDQPTEHGNAQSEGPGYRHLYKRLVGTSAYVTGGQVALMALNFGVLALLARFLTLKDLGIYMILMQIGRIGSLFCQAGANQSSQKFLGQMLYNDPNRLPFVQRRIMLILLLATVVTIAICAGLWNLVAYEIFHGEGLQGLTFFGCFIVVTVSLQAYHASVLRAINHMRQSILSSGLIQKTLLLAGIVFLLFLSDRQTTLLLVLWVWVVAGAVSVLVGWAFVYYRMRKLRTGQQSYDKDRLPSFREIAFTSLPMAVAAGMGMLGNSAGVVIVGAVLGPVSAGIYGPIRAIGNLVLLVSMAIGKSLPATVVEALRQSAPGEVERLCRTAANYSAMAAIPLALLFIFGGDPILCIFFGQKFSGHGALVAIIVLGVLIKALMGSPGGLLQMSGHHHAVMILNVTITIICIALMPFVAKAFGLVGMASLASSFLVLMYLCMSLLAYNKVGVRTYIAPVLLLKRSRL